MALTATRPSGATASEVAYFIADLPFPFAGTTFGFLGPLAHRAINALLRLRSYRTPASTLGRSVLLVLRIVAAVVVVLVLFLLPLFLLSSKLTEVLRPRP